MKKYYLLLIITVLCVIGRAQTERPKLVEVLLFGGPTIGWSGYNLEGYTNKGAKAGGVYGLNVYINLQQTSRHYYFFTGLNARHIRSQVAYKDNYKTDDNTFKNANIHSLTNMVYLSIPTAILLKTTNFGKWVIFGAVGMDNGICVSSKSKDEIEYLGDNGKKAEKTFEKVNNYKKTLVVREAILVVLGFEYTIKDHNKASFALAFNNAFTNTYRGGKNKYINEITSKQVKAHNRMFEFQFGFVF